MVGLKDRVQDYLNHDSNYARELRAIDDKKNSLNGSHVKDIIVGIIVVAAIIVALFFGLKFILAHLVAILVLIGLIILAFVSPVVGIIGLTIYAIWLIF